MIISNIVMCVKIVCRCSHSYRSSSAISRCLLYSC